MKISLIGSYNLADGYAGAARALKLAGVDVDFIPAHLYYSEYPDRHVDEIIKDLKKQNPDIVLWWRAETLEANELFRVKNSIKKPFAMFSWDDPNQFESKIRNVKEKIKYFDFIFSCCEGSIVDYKEGGCDKVFYCPPGFDPEVHFPEEDEKYKCDISIVCTNLYHGNSVTKYHHLSRKVLLEAIIGNCKDLDIRIYGPEGFKDTFPNNYHGWMSFDQSRKVFHNSKINISTHIRPDGYKYFNERVCQIFGSNGFLLVDEVNGLSDIFLNNEHCVYMDLSSVDSLLGQIRGILNNEENRLRIRNSGYENALKNLSWSNWASNIISGVSNG